ncbi:ATP-binding cassette sub-family C member 9-like [Ptychodera flava]|uniref:ATP-binding cassette sub-family C member 9-like n=1 Tax=Ptychodera flava TaxID=63121 RepID=UPI00396A6674
MEGLVALGVSGVRTAWREDNLSMETADSEQDVCRGHCRANVFSVWINAGFLVVAPLVLIVAGCCTDLRHFCSKSLIHFPGHYCKWAVSIVLSVVLLGALGEGILTDVTRNSTTRPHLYAPQIFSIANVIVSLVYYHHAEYWNRPKLIWLLLAYWPMTTTAEVFRLVTLIRELDFNVTILRFYLLAICIALYIFFVALEANLLRTKVFGCWYRDEPYPRDLKKKSMHYNYKYTNLLSQISYWSLNWLFVLGFRRPLELSDLGCPPEEYEARYQYNHFRRAYQKEEARASKKNKPASLWRVYANAYGRDIATSVSLVCLSATFGFIPPLAVGGVVRYASEWQAGELSDSTDDKGTSFVTVSEFFSNGFVLVGVIFVASVLRAMSIAFGGNIATLTSVQLKSALQTFTYEKSLHLSTAVLSGGQMTVGQIMNHMSVDTLSMQYLCMWTIFISSVPYQIVVILILLYLELGFAALIGTSVFLIVTPLQYAITRKMASLQRKVLIFSDRRLKKSNEALQGIKLLKLYGWEELFCTAIEAVRSKEVSQMMKAGVFIIITSFLSQATPIIVTFISFVVYSLTSPSPLTPELAFASLALFNQLVWPLAAVPTGITYLVNAIASTQRFQKFFAASEIEDIDTNGRAPLSRGFAADNVDDEDDDDDIDDEVVIYKSDDASAHLLAKEKKPAEQTRNGGRQASDYGSFAERTPSVNASTVSDSSPDTDLPDGVALKIENGNFSWDTNALNPVLRDINVQIPNGKLTMIIGLVGSGKSSLLSAILQEMTTISGSVRFSRKGSSVSYVPQKPWLQNATLKDNVLFGNEFNLKRYRKVIEVCALQPDIDILPGGDMTEIGEKGINLSGGQKQRVSVARALYSNSAIILMDDPLSALDVHVGSHLMERGIMNFLMKEGRTVILVTHQIQYLQNADMVIIMDDGKITRQGNTNEIASQEPESFSNLKEKIRLLSESELESESDLEKSTDVERQNLRRSVSRIELEGEKIGSGAGTSLIQAEEREKGSVSWKIYYTYAKAIKWPIVLLIFVLFVGQGTAHILNNFWLADWSEAGADDSLNITQEEADDQLTYYLRGYAFLSSTYIILALATTGCQILFSLLAAKRIHIALLRNIVHAPLRFFDTTPIGRILNRFSNDTQLIDQRLWLSINTIMTCILQCTSALVVNTIVTPVFILAALPVITCYFIVMKYFVTTSRELKRLDSISISPVFAHLSETLGGLTTIRAYRSDNRFRNRLVHRLDQNNLAQLYLHTSNRWLGIRLECVGSLIILISCLSSLLSSILGDLEPSRVGLSITYALSICMFLTTLVRTLADCEMQMNAIERVDYYTHVNTEEYQGVYHPPPDWPSQGHIEFNTVSVRYSAELDAVLQNVSIQFQGGQKIGICGRTGSGKSSLTLSLFRMIDTYKGYVSIDGVNIANVPLLTLRNRLSIIPQDPVLFAGTIRFNLDPEGLRDDEELWQALDIAQLKQTVLDLDDQLDAEISDEGENFSVGQRQLFCLARAFLRKSRILIMDEATASVDMKTDAILRNVIQTAFADRTVLTIAHRIASIMDSDMVLVLSDGKIMEYDTPENLLKNPDSLFTSLVDKTT